MFDLAFTLSWENTKVMMRSPSCQTMFLTFIEIPPKLASPLSIAHKLNRYNASDGYRNLPGHARLHWRGFASARSGCGEWPFLGRRTIASRRARRKSQVTPRTRNSLKARIDSTKA